MFETATYDDPLVLDPEVRVHWAFLETSSAAAVLRSVCPTEWADIVSILGLFRLDPSRWLVPGGNRGDIAKQIDDMFSKRGWREIRVDLSTKGIILKNIWSKLAWTAPWN
jgi:hypothetical protein